ncbi:MAG: ABC transporter ATP-binding protein [Firmicutes bacterium]|nr:ABC transporter ATP-binding protein [Bacillota bacterium]
MKQPLLALVNLNKYYGDVHVLKDITFTINEGEFLTLLGPSGCGKTTLLRCIAGLERIQSGDILLEGASIKDLAPNKRNVNTVFQNYALFPHLNVYDNIAYGPRMKRSVREAELKQRVAEVLDLVQMSGYEERMPHQLSGGQRQRIAIARALINEPAILLLDEPLGALDLKLRKHMQTELARLQRKTGTTFVYVTHDQEEALNMSDRIVVIDQGEVQQLGTPRDIYNNPANLFVTSFIGDRNIFPVEVLETGAEQAKVRLGENVVQVRSSAAGRAALRAKEEAVLAILMDKMRVSCAEMDNALRGEVVSIHYAGSQIRIEVRVADRILTVVEYQKMECDCQVGDAVFVSWEESGAVLLPMEAGWEERGM